MMAMIDDQSQAASFMAPASSIVDRSYMQDQLPLIPASNSFHSTSLGERIALRDAELHYIAAFFSKAKSEQLMEHLLATVRWQQERLNFGGRKVLIPRLQAWYGDDAASYRYSGLHLPPLPWTPALLDIRTAIEKSSGMRFNSVLLNYYRNGQDSVAWHSDNEPALGPDPLIASLSLGAERRFELKHRDGKTPKINIELAHGSLLLMGSGLQRHWSHQLPKQPWVTQPRLNLTFRLVH
jgi:alkylated DNA repair dioxygenase AlkB